MWLRLLKGMKAMLVVSLMASVLAGCGGQSVSSTYPLESIVEKNGETSHVYRAENKTVPVVAKKLADQKTPKEISKEDNDHMFLVYSDEWYHLQKDPKKPEDTLIEVDNQKFVQQNYSSSFLQGYITATIINGLFDLAKGYSGSGSYRGYGSKDTYKPTVVYHTPTKQEKKATPPITTSGSGSIIKRSSSADTSSKSSSGSIFKKSDSTSSSSSSGKIIRNSSDSSYSSSSSSKSSSSIFSRPKSNSPPKTSKGFGSLKRRR